MAGNAYIAVSPQTWQEGDYNDLRDEVVAEFDDMWAKRFPHVPPRRLRVLFARIDPALHHRARVRAAEEDMTLSDLAERALNAYLGED